MPKVLDDKMLSKLRDPRINSLDADSKTMIYQGCNLSQLCAIFKMDRRTVTEKIAEVSPSDTRSGYPIYHIREVAPYLVKPAYDVEAYLRRMNHKDLPPQLSKEFWAGLKSKQEYLIKEGELWHTSEVIRTVSELFKTLRMSLLLQMDTIEREMVLTPAQRKRMLELTDGALNGLADAVVEKFGNEIVDETDQDEEL